MHNVCGGKWVMVGPICIDRVGGVWVINQDEMDKWDMFVTHPIHMMHSNPFSV